MNAWDLYNESASTNLSCWEKSQEVSTSLRLPAFLAPLQASIFILYIAAGLPLNCFVIFLIVKFKALRKRDFLLAVHVVVADLIVLFCLPVTILALLISARDVLGPSSCSAIGFLVLLFNGVRFTMMFVLCTDRFCAVFFPFYYSSRSGSVFFALPYLVWGIWVVVAAVPLGLDCYGYEPTTGFCIMQSYCSAACNVYRFTSLSAMMFFGGFIPVVLYSMLFCKARRMARDSGSCETNAIMHSRTRQATLTFFILFLALAGCSIPTYLIFCLSPLAISSPLIFWAYFGISLSLFEAVLLADPIALMRNREVRESLNKLTRCVGGRILVSSKDVPILHRAVTHTTTLTPAASTPSLNAV